MSGRLKVINTSYKDYKISKSNSTVNGDPGRRYDWSKFDFLGKTTYVDHHVLSSEEKRNRREFKAPPAYTDSFFIDNNNQYLHVAYDWASDMTIYRVRPNESMQANHIYHGKKVKRQTAIKHKSVWYWRLEFENN